MRSIRTAARLTAAAAWLAASIACGRSALPTRTVQLTFEGVPPLELRLMMRPEHAARAEATARGAIERLDDWFGAFPATQLTLVDRAGASVNGTLDSTAVAIDIAPLSLARSGALEAALVRALARRYWNADDGRSTGGLASGLALYSAARVLDDQFPEAHALERRYFAGVVPFALRSVPVAGPDSQVVRLRGTPEETRAAFALFTLERYLGWGTLQQALWTFAEDRSAPLTSSRFVATLNAVTGRDMNWFARDAFDATKTYDYGIGQLQTNPDPASAGKFVTSLTVRRFGDAVFSGTARDSGQFHSKGPLDVVIDFADGSRMREQWDGRDSSVQYDYESKSPAVGAAVDPDRVLSLDRHPVNNRLILQENRGAALTWAARWSAWLEDCLLSYAMFF